MRPVVFSLILTVLFPAAVAQASPALQSLKKAAAELNDPGAQFLVGSMYYHGQKVKQDKASAMRWFRQASRNGHARASYFLGLMYLNGESVDADVAKALSYLTSASRSDAEANYVLGKLYFEGSGVAKNYKTALGFFLDAAKKGHDLAHYRIARMHRHGLGVARNPSAAMVWLQRAALRGIAAAQYELALVYRDGTHVAADRRQYREWLQAAADKHYPAALKEQKANRGVGKTSPVVKKAKMEKARRPHKKQHALVLRAERGDSEAQLKLALLCLFGGSRDKNVKKGLRWLRRAAKHSAAAQYRLSGLHRRGQWVPQDDTKALQYLQQSARGRHGMAQYDLAMMYLRGDGVAENPFKAVRWLRRANANGIARAGAVLERVLLKMQMSADYRRR